jgi:hypothetical protein
VGLLASAIIVGLVAPTAGVNAGAATTTHTSGESRAVQWLFDNIALTDLQLSAGQKRLVNGLLRLTTPIICPIVAKAADPQFSALALSQCEALGTAADPWEQLKSFAPLLCTWGGFIFPDYQDLLKIACGLLL